MSIFSFRTCLKVVHHAPLTLNTTDVQKYTCCRHRGDHYSNYYSKSIFMYPNNYNNNKSIRKEKPFSRFTFDWMLCLRKKKRVDKKKVNLDCV